MKVGIIGCGNVGCSCAFALLYSKYPIDIFLYDTNEEKLKGITEDLQDAATINNKKIHASNKEMLVQTDAIVITAGRKQKPFEKRSELFSENNRIVNGIIDSIKNYFGTILIVTNPVEKITMTARKNHPELTILSTGIEIDKVRAKRLFGNSVIVKGTHDDGQLVENDKGIEITCTTELRNVAYRIIEKAGETKYGIAAIVKQIIENIYLGEIT